MLTLEQCLTLLGDRAARKVKNLIGPVLASAMDRYEGLADLATLQAVQLPLWGDKPLFQEICQANANHGPFVSLHVAVQFYLANAMFDSNVEDIANTLLRGEPIRTSVLLVKEKGVLYSVDGLHRKMAALKVFYLANKESNTEFTPMKCVYAEAPEGTIEREVIRKFTYILGESESIRITKTRKYENAK